MYRKTEQNQLATAAQRDALDKKWWKEQVDMLDQEHSKSSSNYNNRISDYRRKKVNYDLFNNILDVNDFAYVCKPFGDEAGELPASMVNRDIISGKIKAMLGMEMKRPFSWRVVATNPEATTRRETEEAERYKQFVVAEIMRPIKAQIEQKYQAEQKGRQLSEQEIQDIQARIAEETKAQTPDAVKKYMTREHQDPAEVMSQQLLEYLIQKCDLKRKFNDTFKHEMLSSEGVMYVGILNKEPQVWPVNSIRFNCDKSPDVYFIEDSEWATCEYRMSPSQVVSHFGDVLSKTEIKKIYTEFQHYSEERLRDSLFTFEDYDDDTGNTIRVLHATWKSLRKIGFVTMEDESVKLVDETYKLNLEAGDIKIEWEFIPESCEGWKIGTDMYKHMRPIPGQYKDLDNLSICKLPYYGVIHDNMNSQNTGLMDRLKQYQYYYNIVMYRLELLLASDKGKKIMMNINAIPASAGMDIEKWKYFFESSPFMWMDPSEEGSTYNDINMMAKQIDLSLASDIAKYIEFAEYLKRQVGVSVGITEAVEGQIGATEAVSNTQRNLVQSSHILEPYFNMHNLMKANVLEALLETAKVAYADNPKRKLTYVLDDMSKHILNLDMDLLDNSTLGLYVANSAKAEEARDMIRQLTHAAMQNDKIELSEIISVIRQDGIVEAEETLKVAEQNKREQQERLQGQQSKAQAEEAERARNFRREEHDMDKELIVLKAEEDRKTKIEVAAITGMSFNPDADSDNDGINDFLEIAKHGVDAEVKKTKVMLDREKFEHQKMVDKEKIALEKRKINKSTTK